MSGGSRCVHEGQIMSTPSIIDVESLLKPIDGDSPAGKDVDYVTAEQLKDWRVEKNPDDYSESDPNRPKTLQPPRWPEIIKLCKTQIEQASKYPILAAHMTEALTRHHGFAGARDGFKLLRRLAEQFMDQLYPNKPIEEPDDIDKYLKGIRWLDDKDKGAQLDKTINEAPLIKYANLEERLDFTVALVDLRSPENQNPNVPEAKLSHWLSFVAIDACTRVQSDIQECLEELDKLLHTLNEKVQQLLQKMSDAAGDSQKLSESEIKNIAFTKVPGMTRCKDKLLKALEQAKSMVEEKNNMSTAGSASSGPVDAGSGRPPSNAGQSRDQLYEQLKQIAKQLEKIDAHSPVPLLILKAVQLRELNFPMLVERLTRDSRVLEFIKEEDPASS